jgi:hypothetical protein
MHPGAASGTSLQDVTEAAARRRATGVPAASVGERVPGPPSSWMARWRSPLVVAGLVLMVAFPLAVALGVLRQPRWYPLLDLAQTEVRVRDVGTGDPPLIGLAGRIEADGRQGSHPGPLSFWALAPFYRMFGATSWALQAAAMALNVAAMGMAVWIAHRRGGLALALGVAAALAVVARAYGPSTLTEAWNPYMPAMWWIVFLLAVWSVACDDLPLLPVAAFAGFFCMQTHISYAVLVTGMGLLLLAFAWDSARRRGPAARRPVLRWTLVAAGLGAVVWVAPVVEQLTNSPGNLSILWEYFGDPDEKAIGPRRGLELLLVRLDPWRLVQTVPASLNHRGEEQLAFRWGTTGTLVPGLIVLAGWATTVVVAWRLRHRPLLRLHLVLGVALLLGAVTLSRIFGYVWYYLSLWMAGVTALMLLAGVWTLAVVVGRRLAGRIRDRAAMAGRLALAGVIALFAGLMTIDAAYVKSPDPLLSRIMSEVVPPTIDALDDGAAPGGGRDGHYLVSWSDPYAIGSQGYGLLLELERAGFDVGTLDRYRASVTPHRVRHPAEATAEIRLSVGPDIETWGARPGVQRVAYFEPRSPAERAEYVRLVARIVEELEAAGLAELAEGNLFLAVIDTRVPKETRDRLVRLSDLGLPTAVFVGPVVG